ncbi:MAG: sensor histidine kinase [Magnetococcus sp. WYHC-3]
MSNSLQARLGFPAALVLLGVLGLQWLLVSLSLNNLLDDHVAGRLEHDAERLLAALSFDASGPGISPRRVDPFFRHPWSGHYYQMATPTRLLRSRSLWDWEMTLPRLSVGERRLLHMNGPDRRPMLVLVRGYRKQGQTITLAVAEDFSAAERILGLLRWLYGGVSLGALLLLLLLLRRQLRQGLAPLAHARRDMEALTQGHRDRLDPAQVPDEVRPFVEEINRLVGVLVRRLHRSRTSAADLSHGIKTPLALLSRLSGDAVLDQHPALQRDLRQQIDLLQRLTRRELELARLSGGRGAGSWFSVHPEVAALMEVMRQLHRERSLTLDFSLPPGLELTIDREDFLTLLGNLLDNACRFANKHVGLHGALEPHYLELRIQDDGPGIPTSRHQALLQRGARGDDAGEGHGLGLAIAVAIAHDYGGSLSLGEVQGHGGLEVTLHLPTSCARV